MIALAVLLASSNALECFGRIEQLAGSWLGLSSIHAFKARKKNVDAAKTGPAASRGGVSRGHDAER